MPRKKKEENKEPSSKKLPSNACPDCYARKKKVVIMKNRGPDTLECSECHSWRPDEKFMETKEQKRKRLEAELAALKEE